MAIEEVVQKFVEVFLVWVLDVAKQHGVFIALLAMLGLLAIISAVVSKGAKALQYFFMLFIALPCIIVVGLFNRSYRKERLKELGEIKSHLVAHPDKWKRMLYYGIFCLMVLFIIGIIYFCLTRFVFPLHELNEYSKAMMQNMTNLTG